MNLLCYKCGISYDMANSCPVCSQRPAVKNNVYLFDDKDFFYGDPPREILQKTLSMNNEMLSPLIMLDYYDHLYEHKRHIGKYLGDPRRIAPIVNFNKETLRNASVLDYGCGLGVFTMNIAESCREVIALDATLERALFTKHISDYLSNSNVIVAKGSLDSPIFLADGQFDLIILNGVLEWTPVTWDVKNPPQIVLLNFLKRIKKLLKPSGIIYIGIEHRYSLDYFLGLPDHHSGLLFGSLLPRQLANIYSIYKNNSKYRTYTFSYKGYQRLFNDAGLNILSDIILYPSYQYPNYICPTDEYAKFLREEIYAKKKHGRKMNLIKVFTRIPFSDVILQNTPPAYGFFVSPDKTSDLVIKSSKTYYLSQDGYIQSREKDKRHYQKISSRLWTNEDAPFNVQRSVRERLKKIGRNDLADLIPMIRKKENIWEEDHVTGRLLVEDLLDFRLKQPSKEFEIMYGNAVSLLSEIYKLIREKEEIKLIEFIHKWFAHHTNKYHFRETDKIFKDILFLFNQNNSTVILHMCPIHGNCSPKNILCNDGKITAFIDWAMAEPKGACEIDLLDGLYCYLRYIIGYSINNQDFFNIYRQLHEQFSNYLPFALPSSKKDIVYFFVAVRNTLIRGRGCYLNVEDLNSTINNWKYYFQAN